MVIDTSAIIAVLLDEASAADIARAIETVSPRLLSAANLLEASIVIESRKGEAAGESSVCCSIEAPLRLLRWIKTWPRSPRAGMAAFWERPTSRQSELWRLFCLCSRQEPSLAAVVPGHGFLADRYLARGAVSVTKIGHT